MPAGLANLKGVTLMLPHDVVIANEVSVTATRRVVKVYEVPEETQEERWRILDIGPETAQAYGETIRQAKTIVWNGPMGVFEMPPFAEGTRAVAQAVCDATKDNGATSIVRL